MCQVFDTINCWGGEKAKANKWYLFAFVESAGEADSYTGGTDCRFDQPQLPELQEPELQPPPPRALAELIENPDRGPASTKSTLIEPQVFNKPASTRNLTVSFSKTLSLSFGSSRANPRDGPAHPPCMSATRSAESMLFCDIYSLSLLMAKLVAIKSDIMPPVFCIFTCTSR